MIQKFLVGLLTVVVAVLTPLAVIEHQQVRTALHDQAKWSHKLAVELNRLSTSPEYTLVRGATRLLYVEDLGNGSGVMIAKGRMLTAAHVAKINEQYELKLNGKRVKVLKIDEELDLALLEVEEDCPCVPLAEAMPKIDAKVTAVGFPAYREGMPQFLTEGTVQGYDVKRKRVTTALLAAPGNSGGGLFSYRDGKWELVGILVELSAIGGFFGAIPVFHITHSVDLESIKKFLE